MIVYGQGVETFCADMSALTPPLTQVFNDYSSNNQARSKKFTMVGEGVKKNRGALDYACE